VTPWRLCIAPSPALGSESMLPLSRTKISQSAFRKAAGNAAVCFLGLKIST
jgi:hypothetical protein